VNLFHDIFRKGRHRSVFTLEVDVEAGTRDAGLLDQINNRQLVQTGFAQQSLRGSEHCLARVRGTLIAVLSLRSGAP
jgi:hypothetical protein